jgi:hypothetical protein
VARRFVANLQQPYYRKLACQYPDARAVIDTGRVPLDQNA